MLQQRRTLYSWCNHQSNVSCICLVSIQWSNHQPSLSHMYCVYHGPETNRHRTWEWRSPSIFTTCVSNSTRFTVDICWGPKHTPPTPHRFKRMEAAPVRWSKTTFSSSAPKRMASQISGSFWSHVGPELQKRQNGDSRKRYTTEN